MLVASFTKRFVMWGNAEALEPGSEFDSDKKTM